MLWRGHERCAVSGLVGVSTYSFDVLLDIVLLPPWSEYRPTVAARRCMSCCLPISWGVDRCSLTVVSNVATSGLYGVLYVHRGYDHCHWIKFSFNIDPPAGRLSAIFVPMLLLACIH